jgi:hypothetical protein
MAFAFPRALGAGHGAIVRMVLASALRLAAIGVVLAPRTAGRRRRSDDAAAALAGVNSRAGRR